MSFPKDMKILGLAQVACYKINCELTGGNQYHDRRCTFYVTQDASGGSQFFICHGRQNTQHLDRHYMLCKFTKAQVIDEIKAGEKIEKIVIVEECLFPTINYPATTQVFLYHV
jgi:cyclophilin family peptidyl-prolyl cis-trans isomerase